jgi:hypothetical protein
MDKSCLFWGPGKTTYTFSVTFRFLLRPFSVLPAGGGGGGGQAETESSLALAENVYVILPTPLILLLTKKKSCITWTTGVNVMKLFSFITDDEAQ